MPELSDYIKVQEDDDSENIAAIVFNKAYYAGIFTAVLLDIITMQDENMLIGDVIQHAQELHDAFEVRFRPGMSESLVDHALFHTKAWFEANFGRKTT